MMQSGSKTAIYLGIGILVAIAGISFGLSTLEETEFETIETTHNEETLQTVNVDKSKFKKAPKLVGISDYINTSPEELQKQIDGKVVLYDSLLVFRRILRSANSSVSLY